MSALRSCVRAGVSVSTLAGAMFLAAPAHAEGWLHDGEGGIGTGLEGGTPEGGKFGFRRARLRVVAGLDLRTDVGESEGMGFRGFVELEDRATFGGEVRHVRWAGRHVGAYAGFIGTLTPETLLGGSVGARFLIPMGRFALFLEPSFSVLPFGGDLPHDGPLVWALFSAGGRLGL